MSKLNGSLYSSERQDWMSPPDLVNRLLKFEKRTHFDLDPACSSKNVPAYMHFTHPEHCGLSQSWDVGLDDETLVYINPPYGAPLSKQWFPKIAEESKSERVKIWVLVPARTETRYQHEYGLTKADFTVFIYERLSFWKDGKPYMMKEKKNGVYTGREIPGQAPFPTMLLYYGSDALEKAQRWIGDPPIAGTLMMRYG